MTASGRRRYVHLLVHHDGAPASRSWRISLTAWRALLGAAALAVVAVLAGLVLLGPLARAAACHHWSGGSGILKPTTDASRTWRRRSTASSSPMSACVAWWAPTWCRTWLTPVS